MRRVVLLAVTMLLSALLMGSSEVAPNPRACGGFTIADADPCCVSGTITLHGVPLSGAKVSAANPTAGGEAFDITDYASKYDPFPTYGFLLDGPELQAEPGDEVTLSVNYKDYSRTVSIVVVRGEQWLDIELGGIHGGEQPQAVLGH